MKAFFRGSVRARLLAGLGLTFVACGAGLPHPTNQHLNIAKQSEPNVSLADLERGRSLYVQKCGSCHALRAPQSLAPEQWRPEIEKMRTQQGVRLKSDETDDINRYLAVVSASTR